MPHPPEAPAEHIKAHIRAHGPLDVGAYMSLALSHPEYGYYMTRDPLGRGGDFTTAPEISQLFGEVLGAWVADIWIRMGRPERFTLLECGPGRGTLMEDMLRAVRGVEGFHRACAVHLLEISPALKSLQAEKLAPYKPEWHADLAQVPDDLPLIVIANEFLDALPLRQFCRAEAGWAERMVGLGAEGGLEFVLRPAADLLIPAAFKDAPDGTIFEISPAREGFVRGLSALLKRAGGAALLIDYGHAATAPGDTFQALRGHKFVPVLEAPGQADLTSHVDFEALARAAAGMDVFGPAPQGRFLHNIGIAHRARYLMQKAGADQAQEIENGLKRLTDSDQMGELFKIMGLSYGQTFALGGF